MSTRNGIIFFVFLAVIGLSGCNRKVAPVGIVEDPTTHLPETSDVAVADWLNLSRAELEQRYEDWKSVASKLLDGGRGDRLVYGLLPKLRPVLTPPVFQSAKFSARAGISLPPYLEEGKRDPAIALHLARYGDADGALLLCDPADTAVVKQIESLRPGRNYPVEWTRLIAVAQFVAELRLAGSDTQGATNLIQIHQQLRVVLDPKAAAGPLGNVLLSGGRRALSAAGVAWQEGKKTGLAGEVAAAISDWGEVPIPALPLAPGASQVAVANAFSSPSTARAVTAIGPAAPRVFDLLSLPLPADEMEGIAAFFDGQDALAELVVLYMPHAGQTYPDPSYLGQRLIDLGVVGQEEQAAKGTLRGTFASGGLIYDITLIPRGSSIGGLVRINDPKRPPAKAFLPPDPRDFGAVHFDRTFDQNRLAVAPDQRSADVVSVTKAAEVRRVAPPGPERGHAVSLPAAAALQLQKLEGFDLLAALTLRWDRGQNAFSLARLAVPLWTAYGFFRLESGADSVGGNLSLVWEGESMRYTLRLPHDEDQTPEFNAEDMRAGSGAAERERRLLHLIATSARGDWRLASRCSACRARLTKWVT